MKKMVITLVIAVGSLCSLLVLSPAKTPVKERINTSPRYRIPNEQRITERKEQLRAIVKVFARRTSFDRAKDLARLCYFKTLNTPFTPVDLAEIALAETGGHRLSGKAVSSRGALGVWQLMPVRARSHGYKPAEMRNDEKCATAAVRELFTKMEMAKGNLTLAKKLYCGIGPDADHYEIKRLAYRQELLLAMSVGEQAEPVVLTQVASAD